MPRITTPQDSKVLVVEHHGPVANALVALLQRHGYRALAAADAAAAMHTARHFQPDAVITEVFLPDLNGVELARALVEMLPSCKLLLMTGSPASVRSLDMGRARGLQFDLLLKPIVQEELLRALKNGLVGDSKEPRQTTVSRRKADPVAA